MLEVRPLSVAECHAYASSLAEVLLDCVEGGASVGFMAPFTKAEADTFFEKVIHSVERGERTLLAAFDDDHLVGTVQIVTALPPNQPHRADIAKLLVKRSARGWGVGAQLMRTVEEVALAAGKTLLVLDTVTGASGERLYSRLGWNRTGIIPGYALFPDGRPCDTTVFWKALAVKDKQRR